MSDVMLLGVLRSPIPNDPAECSRIEWVQFIASAREAAARIEQDAATIAWLERERDDCAIYLKDGETPRQRMDRDHADCLALMGLLAKEKARVEAADAKVAALVNVVSNTKQVLKEISKGPSVGQLLEPWIFSTMALSRAALSRLGDENELHTR